MKLTGKDIHTESRESWGKRWCSRCWSCWGCNECLSRGRGSLDEHQPRGARRLRVRLRPQRHCRSFLVDITRLCKSEEGYPTTVAWTPLNEGFATVSQHRKCIRRRKVG